jgi:two-component system sensor histidine kinase ChiS
LEKLIENLIQFSLAARSELSLNLRSTDIQDVVHSAILRVKEQARVREVLIKTRYSSIIPPVWIDSEKITWVLHQLLDNAIKFTNKGGQVIVDVVYAKQLINVKVSDNGIGIAPERLGELFEPFHQLDSSDTRRYGGVGLGLALTHRILEAHGSTIQVKSKLGKGSQFEFHLKPADNQHA